MKDFQEEKIKFTLSIAAITLIKSLWNNLDSTWVLIGPQVCFHSAMKHGNDVSNMVYSVSKLWEVTVSWKKLKYTYIRALYIVFLFVKTENNNFVKEIKHVIHSFIASWWKPWQSLWEFSSRWNASRFFTDLLLNSPKCLPQFSQSYEVTENTFYFLNNPQNIS